MGLSYKEVCQKRTFNGSKPSGVKWDRTSDLYIIDLALSKLSYRGWCKEWDLIFIYNVQRCIKLQCYTWLRHVFILKLVRTNINNRVCVYYTTAIFLLNDYYLYAPISWMNVILDFVGMGSFDLIISSNVFRFSTNSMKHVSFNHTYPIELNNMS